MTDEDRKLGERRGSEQNIYKGWWEINKWKTGEMKNKGM